jgi:hypothetical protein
MKKVILAITLALWGATTVVAVPADFVSTSAYDQRRDDDRKRKDPPGPPIVKDKRGDQKPKDPPKKGKKPE